MSYAKGCIFEQHGIVYIRFRREKARRMGTVKELPSKSARLKAARPYIDAANGERPKSLRTMGDVIDRFRKEVISDRASTAATENSWINNHIEPKWGSTPLGDFGRPRRNRAGMDQGIGPRHEVEAGDKTHPASHGPGRVSLGLVG